MASTVQLFNPDTSEYAAATKPRNSSATQRPASVALPSSAAEVAAVVAECARRGRTVQAQATGHGAAGDIGDDTVLVGTASLDSLAVDSDRRVATVGAGQTWEAVNKAAEQHGLLGLAGSAPSVGVSGYTFGGGIGWLSRPHGTAAGQLRRVEYVTGSGEVRQAGDDAPDELDREAMWAFRGGGGVGIATELEFGLVEVPELHAGYLLWTIDALDTVVEAWSSGLTRVADDVATSIAVLHVPPAPTFPERLHGKAVVHLAVAAGNGAAGAGPLLDLVRSAAATEMDEWGPADAARLGTIHFDPKAATPAIGTARWLSDTTPSVAREALAVGAPDDSPLPMLEIRSVGNQASAPPGAMATVPAPYIVHAVGALTSADARPAIEDALGRVRTAVGPADVGLAVGSWMEGVSSVPDALPAAVRERVAAIAQRVDPDNVIRRSRFIS